MNKRIISAFLLSFILITITACSGKPQATGESPPVEILSSTDPVQLTLHPDIQHQTMLGFGGALSWYSDLIPKSPHKEKIYQLLFDDLGADIIRLKNWYYPEDYPTQKEIAGMKTEEAFLANQEFHKRIKQANSNAKILYSSWSPPANMKSNDNLIRGSLAREGEEGPFRYAEHAQYWVDVLDHLDWTPDYLSFQNEPGYLARWETCEWRPTETEAHAGYAEALDALYARIKDRPDAPLLIGPEAENIGGAAWDDSVNTFREFTTPLKSRDYLHAYAYHIYNMIDETRIDGLNDEFRMVREEFDDRPNWMTEYSKNEFDWIQSATVIHNTVTKANASAYVYWKMVWKNGSKATMLGIGEDGEYSIGNRYYTIKHFSKFVDEGYQRFEVSGGNEVVRVTGYLSPDAKSITLVLINTAAEPQNVKFETGAMQPDSVQAFQSVAGDFFRNIGTLDLSRSQTLPGKSLTTYVLQHK